MFKLSFLKKKANEAGYSLQRGRQRWLHHGWGYVLENGATIEGYQIFDYSSGCYVRPSYTDLYYHALSFEEAVDLLRDLCAEKGIVF